MLSANDVVKVYETVLSMPGMDDTVKVDLRIRRKTALVFAEIIERGVADMEKENAGMLKLLGEEASAEVLGHAGEILEKAALTELKERLKALGTPTK